MNDDRIIPSEPLSLTTRKWLTDFLTESNRIEGEPPATEAQVMALLTLLRRSELRVEDVVAFVAVTAPKARFRNAFGIPGVQVNTHIAPMSGPNIEFELTQLLTEINEGLRHPYRTHVAYETLHPFTDGNGRSGRAVWLWQMVHHLDWDYRRPFLHEWYYQSLTFAR